MAMTAGAAIMQFYIFNYTFYEKIFMAGDGKAFEPSFEAN
jgi:hypothetical protein